MKPKIIIITLLVLIALAAIPATAQTITMSNPGGIAERDIIVYNYDGSMHGYYNSTSVITLNGSLDYIFTVKPLSTNPLEDPADWFANEAFPWVQSNVIGLLALAVLIAIAFGRR